MRCFCAYSFVIESPRMVDTRFAPHLPVLRSLSLSFWLCVNASVSLFQMGKYNGNDVHTLRAFFALQYHFKPTVDYEPNYFHCAINTEAA